MAGFFAGDSWAGSEETAKKETAVNRERKIRFMSKEPEHDRFPISGQETRLRIDICG